MAEVKKPITSTSAEKVTDVVPISSDIVSLVQRELGADSQFGAVRIYGTRENPLFIARDIVSMLGIKDLKYYGVEGSKRFQPGIHTVTISVYTSKGVRDAIAFTERGLIDAIYYSNTELAQRFRNFVFVVLKRLATHGMVTIEQAQADQAKLAELDRLLKKEQQYCEEEHKRCKELEDRLGIYHVDYIERGQQMVRLQNVIDRHERSFDGRASNRHRERVVKMMTQFGKPVHVMLMPPPAEYKEEYQYTLDDDPARDATGFIYGIQPSAESKTRKYITTVYMPPKTGIDDLDTGMLKRRFGLVKKKTPGEFWPRHYACMLDEIVDVAMEFFNDWIDNLDVVNNENSLLSFID